MRRLWLVPIALLFVALPFNAQEAGTLGWSVWKVGNDNAQVVASFDSEEDAAADQDRRNAANKQADRVSFIARRQPGNARFAPLQGRQGVGAIGASTCKIEFRGEKFIVSGDLEGDGSVVQFGAGAVVMETPSSIYRGLIDGDRVYGLRVRRDGSERPSAWRFDLEPLKVAAGST